MTLFDDLAPTVGDQGNSYEWMLDVASLPATSGTEPSWLNVPDITGLNPAAPPKVKDGSTYANKGSTANQKVGEDFNLDVSIKGVKDTTGEFQPELVLLIEAADAKGVGNIVAYRYYHATSPSLAYQGTAAVSWTRGNNGNDDIEFFAVSLSGQGDRTKITNPNVTP